jgi:hypothetical protein
LECCAAAGAVFASLAILQVILHKAWLKSVEESVDTCGRYFAL